MNRKEIHKMKYSEFYKSMAHNALVMEKPLTGAFELTSRCNLRCKMCYICGQNDTKESYSQELSTAQWIEMGKQASEAGVLFLLLTGGEIFMRKDFFEIYDALTNMGFIITLYTNGTLINDEIIQRLTKIPPYQVSITVYGANPDTYGKVTGHPEAYEKVVNNARKLIAAGINTELKTTVIHYNKGEYKKLAELAWSMDLGMRVVNYISPRREGSGTDPLSNRLDPLELLDYEIKATESARELYKKADSEKEVDIESIAEDVMSGDPEKKIVQKADASTVRKTAFRCAAGKYGFWVTYDGRMTPCGLLSDIYSDALSLGFIPAWNDIKSKCASVSICHDCENCSYYSTCTICPARIKAETGGYEKAAPYICDYTKARDALLASHKI